MGVNHMGAPVLEHPPERMSTHGEDGSKNKGIGLHTQMNKCCIFKKKSVYSTITIICVCVNLELHVYVSGDVINVAKYQCNVLLKSAKPTFLLLAILYVKQTCYGSARMDKSD